MKKTTRFAIVVLLVLLSASLAQAKTNEEKRADLFHKPGRATSDETLLSKEKEILRKAQDRYDTYKKYYAQDHLTALPIPNDLTQKLEKLYGLLASADALTFMPEGEDFQAGFQKSYPGYSGRGGVNFDQARKDLMEMWQEYSFGTIEANNREALDIKNNLTSLLTALNNQDTANLTAAKGLGYDSVGYTQILQARNQIKLFAAQEIVNLRLDVLRQIEAHARYAAERQQRKTDKQAAFDKAVNEGAMNIWHQLGSAQHRGY